MILALRDRGPEYSQDLHIRVGFNSFSWVYDLSCTVSTVACNNSGTRELTLKCKFKCYLNGQGPVTYTTRSLCQQMCLLSAKKVNSYEERKNKLQYRKNYFKATAKWNKWKNDENKTAYQMLRKIGLVVRATEEETYFEEWCDTNSSVKNWQ